MSQKLGRILIDFPIMRNTSLLAESNRFPTTMGRQGDYLGREFLREYSVRTIFSSKGSDIHSFFRLYPLCFVNYHHNPIGQALPVDGRHHLVAGTHARRNLGELPVAKADLGLTILEAIG